MMNRDEKKCYRVSDMCRLTGTTRKSLYLYDKEGILKPVRREGSQQHKIYGEEQLNTLKEIERYRKAGFLLEEIRLLLESDMHKQKEVVKAVLQRLDRQEELILMQRQRTQEILEQMEQNHKA